MKINLKYWEVRVLNRNVKDKLLIFRTEMFDPINKFPHRNEKVNFVIELKVISIIIFIYILNMIFFIRF